MGSMQHYIGALGGVTGMTATRTIAIGGSYFQGKGNVVLWTGGCFGWSGTTASGLTIGGASVGYGVAVWANFNGVSMKLAETTGIYGISAVILPLVNEGLAPFGALGTTQTASLGILTPKTLVITGVSAGVGITYGGVLSAALYHI